MSTVCAATAYRRIGIDAPDHDAPDPGFDQRPRAGGGLPTVSTRFKRHICGRAKRSRPRIGQRLSLGMGSSTRRRSASPGDFAILDDQASNRWIRGGSTELRLRKRQRDPHVLQIGIEALTSPRSRSFRIGRRLSCPVSVRPQAVPLAAP